MNFDLPRLLQQFVNFFHHFKSIRDVENISFAVGPAAVCVKVDGAAFIDEAPANYMGLFSVAAGGKTFRVSGG